MEKKPGFFDTILDAAAETLDIAVKSYGLVGRNWQYFISIMIPALVLHVIGALAIYFTNPDMNHMRRFLVNLPAYFFMAWYLFAGVRFIALNEKVTGLAKEGQEFLARSHAKRLSIIIILLFNMAVSFIGAMMHAVSAPGAIEDPSRLAFPSMILFFFMLWGLRFGVLYVATAINYPIRKYLELVQGLGFSFRIVFLALLVSLPPAVILMGLLSLLLGDYDPTASLSAGMASVLITANSFLSYIMLTLINAGMTLTLQKRMVRT